MRNHAYIILTLIICTFIGNAKEVIWVYERDLLKTNTASALSSTNLSPISGSHGEFPYMLAYESDAIHDHGHTIKIRVWDRHKVTKSWPGLQPQIIQLVDANGTVLAVKKVGGEPMMTDAWTAQMTNVGRLFVYIKCRLRGRFNVPGVFIYEIDDTLSIIERGVYFDKDALTKEKKWFEAENQRLQDEREKTSSNQVPEDMDRKLADPQY